MREKFSVPTQESTTTYSDSRELGVPLRKSRGPVLVLASHVVFPNYKQQMLLRAPTNGWFLPVVGQRVDDVAVV